ncbi:sigma-70 family RNA polymerase sigma factor [Fimbriiglobus ruber]|uniref:High-affnity carbon uptake protein Hat/HatR n=1 Tax=Fimbriiglobus ruber TaxID=1908690 RepID=A0A225D8T4_9BACT|nr:sigma-70 family RNA polymerase sigma factor [Fimbriiglobus ruber]OWK36054.1 High-affnity carbon uptake protein Hat/HatR [Fimbriiglobus ruber]
MARSLFAAAFGRAPRSAGAEAPDAELLRLFATARDQDAFAELVRRHGRMVLGVCQRALGTGPDAEDAFQVAFLILAQKAGSGRRTRSVAGWLHGVARHTALNARRSRMRRLKHERTAAELDTPAPTATAAFPVELHSVLDEELARLPEAYRTAFVLCCLEGRTRPEAAAELGCSEGTVSSRLNRARSRLQAGLGRRGVALAAAVALGEAAARGDVPAALATSTARIASLLAAGASVVDVAPPAVTTLFREMIRVSKTSVVLTGTVLTAFLALAGWSLANRPTEGEKPSPPAAPVTAGAVAENAAPAHVDAFGDPLPAEALARLGTIRFRHRLHAYAIAFSPDGRHVASAGMGTTVHIWETATGKEHLRFDADARIPGIQELGVDQLAFSPDGKLLAGVRINGPTCLWDAATGREVRQLAPLAGWVAFSPDGKTVAYGLGRRGVGDALFHLVETETGKEQYAVKTLEGEATRGVFSPDGKTLAVADSRGIHLCDLAARKSSLIGSDAGTQDHSLAFSPDGRFLAVTRLGDKHVQLGLVEIARRDTRWVVTSPPDLVLNAVLFTTDGKALITGHKDGSVQFWNAETGKETRRFRAHNQSIQTIALSPDGRTLATTSHASNGGEHTLRLWETATGKPLARPDAPDHDIGDLAFSPDGRLAITSEGGVTRLWDTSSGKQVRRWKGGRPAVFTPDGRFIVCDGPKAIQVLDATDGKVIRQFSPYGSPYGIRCLALSRDGATLATTWYDKHISLWDMETGQMLHDLVSPKATFYYRLVFSPDGSTLASVTNHVVVLWDTKTGKSVREIPSEGNIGDAVFSPDGKLLVYATSTVENNRGVSYLRFHEIATAKEVRLVRCSDRDQDRCDCLTFSPDGRTVIGGSQHGNECIVWEVATGGVRHRFRGHQAPITSVAVSPDGRTIASGSVDTTALMWDATGRLDRRQPAERFRADQLDAAWADLAAQDAAIAFHGIRTLRAAPRQAVPLIEQQLKIVPRADPKQTADAIRDLDSDQFMVRAKAFDKLEKLGEAAESAINEARARDPSPEVAGSLGQLLDRLQGQKLLRRLRAVEVLEQVGDAESRRLLAAFADGAPGARLTTEARAALDRLGR